MEWVWWGSIGSLIAESAGKKLILNEAVVAVNDEKKLEFLVYNHSNDDIMVLSELPVAEIMVKELGTLIDPAEVKLDAETTSSLVNTGISSDPIAVAETNEPTEAGGILFYQPI